MRCGLVEEEEHTVARYLGGMHREIHDVVVLQQYWSYDDVFKLAIQPSIYSGLGEVGGVGVVGEVGVVSEAKNLYPLRKNPKLPYAEKTQVGSVPSSSAGVKHLISADSRNVGGTHSAWDVLLKPPADKFENHNLLCRIARAQSSSPVESK
ncbi:hypothetical protein L3X38_027117 [Prunus dulcis]|uniref:Uncharacterized protein n=1 Tax=Prunus dulcis TaxID=3755 RepID=A0AAD4VPL7_PRUDU|nr:hypothetical protein L3X38_027117 [Prunus dulcis]